MTSPGIASALAGVAAPLRRRTFVAGVLAAVAAGTGVLALGAWLVRWRVVESPAWVIVAWLLAAVTMAWVVAAARRRLVALEPAPLAATLEATGRFREGSLRLLLLPAAGGTSHSLRAAADARVARDVTADGPAALADLHGWTRRMLGRAAVTLAGAAALLVLAGPVHGTAAALWDPGAAFALLSTPVRLAASEEAVGRGESVTFSMSAAGRRDGVLWTRAPGEGWSAQAVRLDDAGVATRVVGPLEGDLLARFESGGRESDTVQVRVRLAVFLGSLQVTAEYPAYLNLEPETMPFTGDTLLIPAGTRLVSEGRASSPLRHARWTSGELQRPLDVRGSSFGGVFQPAEERTWRLELEAGDGEPVAGLDASLTLRVVPDLPPEVEVPAPGIDTVMAAGGLVPLVVDTRDDHGLTRVVLELRTGGEPARLRDLDLPPDAPDRALIASVIDLEGMSPGDTLRYRVVAYDNSPARQAGRSREMLVVIPTPAEMRDLQRESVEDVASQLDSLARRGRELERQTEDLSRLRARGEESGRRGDQSLSFEESSRASEVARTQEELLDDMQRLQDELRRLEQAAEAAGIADSTFMRRLAEIRQELERAMTPELRERLAELQEALRNLDAPRTREAMRQLAEVQQQMREALERSRELFERAALEQELGALGQAAAEVAEAQREWTESVMRADSARAAAEERALAARADSLATGMQQAAERLDSQGARQEMAQTAGEVQEAAETMRQAAQSAAQGQRQQARQQGQRAQSQLSEASQQVGEQREQQQQEWREEVVRALDQALLETTRLTQRQLGVTERYRAGSSAAVLRADQAVVEEGVRQLLEQVMTAGGQNALVPPRIAGALAAARLEMARAREAISSATLNLREGSERAGEAVDALHVAAFMLLRARADVSGSSSGSGMAEAMERMAQLAQQQGGIGQDASGLLSMMNSPAFDQQLVELASRQRQMSRELDRLRAETDAGGAEQFAEEARELARQMEAGRLDPETVARQERLFRRMLDSGRMLQGEEQDEQKERQGTTAEGIDPLLPAALRDRLREADRRLRLPSWEELQRFSPEERRLVADYFRRLGGGGR